MTENAVATVETAPAPTSSLERRIDMTVVLADIEQDVAKQQMSRTVKMAGFRPGKVPMKMIAQQYGSQARSESLGAAVERAFGEQVRAQNLRVAGYPRIEPSANAADGQLGFSAIFEVYPSIQLADVSSQAV